MKVAVITSTQDKITEAGVENSAAKLIPQRAVLFVTRSGILAHSFPIATTRDAVAINQDLKAIVPFPVIDHKYLAWVLRYFERNVLASCSKHGTTVNSIEIPSLKSLNVPIAPLNEQRRIVAKIEELFSELDKGIEALVTAREQLKLYRQSVLKQAFEGKLTEDWRSDHQKIEIGSTLRLRVLELRRQEWEAAERERFERQGMLPKNDRWKSLYRRPDAFESENLPPLPAQWCWAGLDELVSGKPRSMQSGPFGSNLRHSEFHESGVLVIGIDNVHDGTFSMGSEHRISEQKFQELEKYQAKPGDLLVTVMASLGRTCVVPRDLEKAIITKHVYRISMEDAVLYPEFFNLLLQSPTISRKHMFKNAQGQTRPGLNSSILKALPIPLCSKSEQIEVVSRVSSQLSSIDSAISEIKEQLVRTTVLRHSILKKAFTGQLVAQDPQDEPASLLLARIRAERDGAPTTKSTNGRNGHKNKNGQGKKKAA